MKDLDILLEKLIDCKQRTEAKQIKKPLDWRLDFINALARTENDLRQFKQTHRRVLSVIL